MRKLTFLASTILVAAPLAAFADTVTGPYVSLGAGYNILQDQFLKTNPDVSGIPSGTYPGQGRIDPVPLG